MNETCEVKYTVCDADFGYWNDAWGEVPVYEFPCEEPAVVVRTVICEHGADQISVCAHHFGGGQ